MAGYSDIGPIYSPHPETNPLDMFMGVKTHWAPELKSKVDAEYEKITKVCIHLQI